MSDIEKAVLEAVKRTPEKLPNGELWKITVGRRSFTRAYIIDFWNKDQEMKEKVVTIFMDHIAHLSGPHP